MHSSYLQYSCNRKNSKTKSSSNEFLDGSSQFEIQAAKAIDFVFQYSVYAINCLYIWFWFLYTCRNVQNLAEPTADEKQINFEL